MVVGISMIASIASTKRSPRSPCVPKLSFRQLHTVTQTPFRRVVRRFDMFQKEPQVFPVLLQFHAHAVHSGAKPRSR